MKELLCGEEHLVRLADGWDGAMGGVERVGTCVGAGSDLGNQAEGARAGVRNRNIDMTEYSK